MTSVTTPNKTSGTSLFALAETAASTTVAGSSVDVSSKFAGIARIRFGRTTASAPSAGVTFRFESGPNVAGKWATIASYTTGIAAATNTTPSASTGKTITVGSVTGLSAQDVAVVSASHTSPTDNNTEWLHIVSAASTTVTAEDNLKNTTAYSSGGLWNKAEIAAIPLDLAAVTNLRVVVDGSAHNQAFLAAVDLDTMDSVTST